MAAYHSPATQPELAELLYGGEAQQIALDTLPPLEELLSDSASEAGEDKEEHELSQQLGFEDSSPIAFGQDEGSLHLAFSPEEEESSPLLFGSPMATTPEESAYRGAEPMVGSEDERSLSLHLHLSPTPEEEPHPAAQSEDLFSSFPPLTTEDIEHIDELTAARFHALAEQQTRVAEEQL